MKNKLLILITIFSIFSCEKSEKVEQETSQTIEQDSIKDNNVDLEKTQQSQGRIKAPDFSLVDVNGKNYSLSDFNGKYVYIDIWATWCGPCKIQIPFMKELEKQFHDAPIHFVSVSLDKETDKPLWRRMIKDYQMSGVQLFAGKENNFGYDYKIQYIPTFILLDKEGHIMLNNAPPPMNYKTREVNQQLVDIFQMMD